jgi:hypothetical protein
VCHVKDRPNDVEYLKLLARGWFVVRKDFMLQLRFSTALIRYDHICRTFGFNNCVKEVELENLPCIYNDLMNIFSPRSLEDFLD